MSTSSLFASDNVAGCDERVWARVAREFSDASATRSSYSRDATSVRVHERLAQLVGGGERVDVQLVYNGTAANVVGLACVSRPYDAVLVGRSSHLYTAECGAVERFVGARCVPVESNDALTALLDVDGVERALESCGPRDDVHAVRPRVLSITQVNEFGCVYSLPHLASLRRLCDRHGLLLHVDGARISNAAVALGCSLADVLQHADLASFGMTKNGALCGEALLLFRSRLLERGVSADDLDQAERVRKQAMQLHSKSAFLAAQFDAFLDDAVWRRNAAHANDMARRLAQLLAERVPAMAVTRRVDSNAVFVRFPTRAALAAAQRQYASLGAWAPPNDEVRLMCSYATTAAQVDALVQCFSEAVR